MLLCLVEKGVDMENYLLSVKCKNKQITKNSQTRNRHTNTWTNNHIYAANLFDPSSKIPHMKCLEDIIVHEAMTYVSKQEIEDLLKLIICVDMLHFLCFPP